MQHWINQILAGQAPDINLWNALDTAVEQFPYSATLHALRAKAMYNAERVDAPVALRQAAVRVPNRALLMQLIEAKKVKPAEADSPNVHETVERVEPSTTESETTEAAADAPLDELEELYLSEAMYAGAALELIQNEPAEEPAAEENTEETNTTAEAKEEAAGPAGSDGPSISEPEPNDIPPTEISFVDWLKTIDGSAKTKTPEPPSTKSKLKHVPQSDLINSFIEKEAEIVPKRAEFFSPAKAARKSLEDNDELVTETLAKVYEAQGNYSKAIATYNKLGLLHPEKSTYFAARISELKNRTNKS